MTKKLTAPDRIVLLLSLVPYLTEHGPTSVAKLAEAFDADPRMLRQLIAFLGTAGIPGETRTYQDEDLFDIDWQAFEDDDIVSLTRIVAVDDAPRFSGTESAALIAGLQSLVPMLPESERPIALSAMRKLGSARTTGDEAAIVSVTAEPEDARLSLIAAAIDAGVRIAFGYRDVRGRRTRRKVEPAFLRQSGDAWYVRGYCLDRGEDRTFLVEQMSDVRMLEEQAVRRDQGRDPATAASPVFQGVTARVRVREDVMHRIAGFSPRVVGTPSPGWLEVEIDLAHAGVAIRLVQLAPGEIVVESPEEARTAVHHWAERALAPYDA